MAKEIIKGEVWHKGNVVPVQVEVNKNWLELPGVIVHIPKEYYGTPDLIHMIEFTADLDDKVRKVSDKDKEDL